MSSGLVALLVFTCVFIVGTCAYAIGFMNTVMYRLKNLDDGISVSKNREENKRYVKVWLSILVPALILAVLSLLIQ